MQLARLMPPGDPLSPEAAADELRLHERAPADRPYVVLNMVGTVDGHTAIDGVSAPMSSDVDRAFFHALRGRIDAVLAGTRTLRQEGYRRLIRDPDARAAREARGLQADPLAVILSRSGDVPTEDESPLLAEPEQPRVIYTGADADPAVALRRLRTEHDVRVLLCEGGSTLNGGLLRAGLVDELLLTRAPVLAGGGELLPIIGGDEPHPVRLGLERVLEADGSLFLRYSVGERL